MFTEPALRLNAHERSECDISYKTHPRVVIWRRMEALICMLGDGSAPLFPNLAFVHPLIETRRDPLFVHFPGSWCFICLLVYSHSLFLLLPPASSFILQLLLPAKRRGDKYSYTFLSCLSPNTLH